MGNSKAALFLDRVVAAARPVFDEVLAVHRADGEPLPLRTIFEDPHEGEGAIFGIERALRDARGKCFVIAVDYPLVTTELLHDLATRFEASQDAALVPEWDGHPQPLCAAFDASLLPLLQKRIAAGSFDVKGLLTEAHAQVIPEAELRALYAGEPLMNVNTPEELEAAEKLYE